MKYKALLLGFLLLLPLGLVALPTRAHQFVQPALSVFPPTTKFFGPSLKSTNFNIDVFLWNNPMSGVDVYAFDFTIDWSSIPAGWISLVSGTAHSPWTNYFIIANGNTTNPPTNWRLSMTAVPPSTGFFDVNASVLTLVFHIDKNICYPGDVTGFFNLTNVVMSGDGTNPVNITNMEIDNGTFEISAPQPNIDITTTDPAYNATTNTITEKCVSHTFDIEVDLSNVTNVYGFSFTLTYNQYYLETDAQKITFKAAFPPPYETLSVDLSHAGFINITLIRPSEKPTVQADIPAMVPAVDIIFHTIDAAYNPPTNLPTPVNTTITLLNATLFYKCPTAGEYDYGFGNHLLLFPGGITYAFKPSRLDLNEDCVIDVQDLMVLLPYFGTITAVGGFGDISTIGGTHLVDIFDFVAIAKHFGPVDP